MFDPWEAMQDSVDSAERDNNRWGHNAAPAIISCRECGYIQPCACLSTPNQPNWFKKILSFLK